MSYPVSRLSQMFMTSLKSVLNEQGNVTGIGTIRIDIDTN